MNRGFARVVACVVLVAMFASGCETMQRRTTQGALIGTLVGAGAGALIDDGDRGRGAGIGAAVGAAAGAGVGYYLDRQKQKLEQVPGTDVRIEEKDGKQQLVVTMKSALMFETDSFSITHGQESLDGIAETLNEFPESTVMVKGYTDSRGSEQYNLDLSRRRAEAVKNYLIAKRVGPSRITAVGFGESFPVASNDTESGRQQNRRVEIDIIPTESG
jgi:outer membrane protein OmpA-like peptidoglycan-associated protein